MKKFYSIIALMLLFVGSAWGEVTTVTKYTLTNIGDYINTVDGVKAVAGSKILIYLPNTTDTGNKNHTSYLTCNSVGTNVALSCTSTVPSSGDDITNMLFTLEATDANSTTFYLQAPNGEYLTSELTSQSNTAITTSATEKATFTIVSLDNNCVGFKRADTGSTNLYINIQENNWNSTPKTIDYWSGAGGWSQWYVYQPEYTTSEVSTVDVTYRVIDANGNELISATGTEVVGGTPTMPSSFSNDYVTLSDPTPATVDANTETITYTATINLPFTSSTSYEDATWYYTKVNSSKNRYLVYGESTPYSLVDTKVNDSPSQLWAFSGNPYKIQVFNQAAGAGKELGHANTSNPEMINATTDGSTYWVLVKDGTGFALKVYGGTNYANDLAGGGSLKYWNAADAGSMFSVEKYDANWLNTIKEQAIAELSSYVTNLQLLFDNDALTTATSSINVATSSDYESVIASAKTTFMQSAAGKPFYLHTYYNSGRPEGTLRDNNSKLAVDTCSYESEFQFVTTSTGIALQNVFTGNYVQDVTQSREITTGSEPKDFNIVLDEVKNVVNIGQTGNYSYIHNGAGNIVGWTTGGAAKWIIRSYSDTDADMLAGAAYQIEQINNNRIGTKWGDYKATDEYTSAYSTFTSDGGNTKANYKAVLDVFDNLTEFVGSEGFVNIARAKNAVHTSETGLGNSIGLKTGDENEHIHAQTTDLDDANQMWLITSSSQGKVKLFNVNAQRYMGPNVNGGSSTVTLQDSPQEWTIEWSDDEVFILKSGTGQYDHLNYENGAGNQGNLNHWSGNDAWAATPVASINLPVHAVGDYSYATICYPFEVELSAGTAYKATYNSANSSLTLASIGQTVPAGTPVVVVVDGSSVESITATINGTETKAVQTSDDNALSGTYLPLSITAQNDTLTLGTDGTNAGFYKWAGSIQNKAFYIYSGGTQAKGFAFSFGDDDPTGISEELIKEAVKELQGQRYNVQGQPVGADYKGIIIQNGKKYLQK